MKIKLLTLYKTNLDPSYNNVYDDYNNVATYKAFLDAAFGTNKIEISITNGYKSRQDVNGNFNFVLAGYDSMALHDYNYLVLSSGDSYFDTDNVKFAFITSVESLDDKATDASALLSCKLDAWTENYLHIKDIDQGYIEKTCTIDSHDASNSHCFDKTFTPSAYKTLSVDYMSKELIRYPTTPPSGYDVVPDNFAGKLRVLWLRVKCDPFSAIDDNTHSLPYNHNSNDFIFQGAYPDEQGIVMIPVALYWNDDLLSLHTGYRIAMQSASGGFTEIKAIERNAFPKLRNILYGKYIFGADYTFFPPFYYNIFYSYASETGRTFLIQPQSNICVCDVRTVDKQDAVNIIRGFAYPIQSSVGQAYTEPWKFGTQFISKKIIQYQKGYTPVYSRYADVVGSRSTTDYMACRYPFCKTTVIANGKQIDINPSTSEDIYLYVDLYSARHPSYFITNDSYYGYYIRNSVSSNGYMVSMTTKYDEYISQNRNQIEWSKRGVNLNYAKSVWKRIQDAQVLYDQAKTGMLQASMGQAPTAAMNLHPENIIVDAMFDYQTRQHSMGYFNAREKDMENYPSEYSLPNIDAGDDLYMQDDIVIVNSEGYWNNYEKEQFLEMCHLYGYSIACRQSPTSIRKDVFDFDSFENCCIVGVKNANDRAELNEAFRRGIRRWHIGDATTNTTRRNILAKFITYIPNYDISYV